MHCKKIRNDKNDWQQVEEYVCEHSDADFSHSICPDCLEKHYPQLARKIEAKIDKAIPQKGQGAD